MREMQKDPNGDTLYDQMEHIASYMKQTKKTIIFRFDPNVRYIKTVSVTPNDESNVLNVYKNTNVLEQRCFLPMKLQGEDLKVIAIAHPVRVKDLNRPPLDTEWSDSASAGRRHIRPRDFTQKIPQRKPEDL